MALLDSSSSLEVRPDAGPVDSSLVRLFVSELTTDQYIDVALAIVLLYHSMITFDKEVRYFWPNPRSSVSIIYFANRYIGMLSAICYIIGKAYDSCCVKFGSEAQNLSDHLFTESLTSCRFTIWTVNVTTLITVLLIEYILLIRVSALFHQDKRLTIALKVLLGLGACIVLGILIYGNVFEGIAVGSLAEGKTVCLSNRNPPRTLFIVPWLAFMVYGMIPLLLALYKAAEYWKLSSGFKGFHLVRVLIKDHVIYYGFVIFCSVCQIATDSIVEISPFAADVLNVMGSPTLLCVLGGQLLINLKEAGERGVNGGTNYTPSNSVSDIDFGENDAVNEQGTGLERSTGTEGSV